MSLKIGVIYDPPVALKCALDPECPDRGYLVDATMLACQWLRLNCSFVWYEELSYGDADENGTSGTGLVGAIQRGQFDTSIPAFTPTFRRSTIIDFSSPYSFDDVVLMTRAPSVVVSQELNSSFLRIFQWSVWVVLLITLILACFLIRYFARNFLLDTNNKSLSISFFDLVSVLIRNDFKTSLTRFSSPIQLIIGAWLMGAAVLQCAYTGILFSNTVSTAPYPFTDLETFLDCLERKQCQMVTLSQETSFFQRLLSDPSTSRFQPTLQYNPVLTESSENIINKVLNEKEKYLTIIGDKRDFLRSIGNNQECNFYMVDVGWSDKNGFPLAKKSPHRETLNLVANTFRELGFDEAVYEKSSKSFPQASCNKWVGASLEKSNIKSIFFTSFYLYAAAILFEILVFLVEICLHHFRLQLGNLLARFR